MSTHRNSVHACVLCFHLLSLSLSSSLCCLLKSCTLYYYFQVSTNGLISFRNECSSFSSSPFSSYSPGFFRPLIAPLWTDFDPSRSGFIYYRTTNDSLVLERICNVLFEKNDTFVDYAPSLAFIVTWDKIPLFHDESLIVSSI